MRLSRVARFFGTKFAAPLAAAGLVIAGGLLAAASPAAAAPHASGVTVEQWVRIGSVTFSKLPPPPRGALAATLSARARAATDRSLSPHPSGLAAIRAAGFAPPVVTPTPVSTSAPGLQHTWQGINALTERTAEVFTFTPPDQGLCTGNGFVFEIVNNAVKVFHANGTAASPTVGTNAFFGLPPAFDPKTSQFGPIPTDPTCTYDPSTGRWFVNEVALSTDPKTGNYTGVNKATLAVSHSSDPLGGYDVYQLDLTNTTAGGMHVNCPCIGDFPKIAVDSHGLFLSTNEYPFFAGTGFFGNGYNGAQLYASSKRLLASGASSVPAIHFNDTTLSAGGRTVPGFTVWPATVPGSHFVARSGGSEYFVSSTAGMEANPKNFTGFSNLIGVYKVSNTSSLDSSDPDLTLAGALLPSETYGIAPFAAQRPGSVPLRDCLAVTCRPGVGPSDEQQGSLDPSDTRPLTVWYAHGRLTMALDTVMQVHGDLVAGPAWFVIDPSASPASAHVLTQGYIGVSGGNNLIFPTVATAPDGTGVMGLTVSGHTYYPAQAYLHWAPSGPSSAISRTAPGAGPLDDFCQYNFFNCAGNPTTPTARPRYGDYAWATFMNGAVYVANEVVSSSCTFAQFNADPTCGGTRAPLSNWSTRISVVKP